MKKHSLLAVSFSFVFLLQAHAQLFLKIDEDFSFNGTDLSLKGHDHTVGCTLVEENEIFRVFVPKKTTIKYKKYTLSNIIYITNLRNEIYEIQAMNTGDFVEKAQLRLDLAHGAKNAGHFDDAEANNYVYYKFMRTTDVYKQMNNSDTAYVIVIMDWYLDKAKEYRENHTFLPVLGKSVKDTQARDFLSAYDAPDKRNVYQDLKWFNYYQFGLELYLHSDTIMQAKVFSEKNEYQKFKGPLPFDLTMDDTRKIIRQKFGDPPSASPEGNTWYYRKPGLQVHITFNNANEPASEEDNILVIVFAVKKD